MLMNNVKGIEITKELGFNTKILSLSQFRKFQSLCGTWIYSILQNTFAIFSTKLMPNALFARIEIRENNQYLIFTKFK